jgi:CubicO group peptidase (beta-lactamase class C family)
MIPGRASLAVAALGVAATVVVSCAQAQRTSSVAASIDTLMTDLHERGLFNGAVVVGRDDEILYERGFGLANVAEGVPFTPNTPSNGASLGKTLTAAAILMLHEDGRIDLDDPVTRYLPEFPYPEITVRHLITHSSGLHPDNVYFMFLAPEVDTWTNEGLLEILIEHKPPLAFPPGSAFVYSGTGFNMAAILIERVAGTSYASFLQERVFDPLEMDSSFVPPAEASDWPGVRTHAYRRLDDGTLELADPPDNQQVYGHGRLHYSARDLYRWVASFYTQPVLSESALQAGLAPPVLSEHPSGLNLLNWYSPETGRRFYFTGESGQYTFTYWDADRRQAVVYMSNVSMPSWLKSRLAIALIDILEGRRPAPLEAPEYIELAPSIFDEFPSIEDFASILGVYETESGARVSIENPSPTWMNVGWVLEDGWFAPLARVNEGLRYNMFPVDNGILYVPGLDAWIGFEEGDDGPVIHWTTVFEGTRTGTRTRD